MMNINVQIAELQGTWDTGEVIIGGNVECDKIIGEKYCNVMDFTVVIIRGNITKVLGCLLPYKIYGEFDQSM